MNTQLTSRLALAVVAAFLFSTTAESQARAYGVTSGGRAYAVGPRGAAVAGPNGAAAVGRYGGAAAVGPHGGVAVRGPVAYPSTYIRTIPAGYRTVYYGGYNCFYVGGIYYRPVIYQGTTVYVVVN